MSQLPRLDVYDHSKNHWTWWSGKSALIDRDHRILSEDLDAWPEEACRYLAAEQADLTPHLYVWHPLKGKAGDKVSTLVTTEALGTADLLTAAFELADCLDPALYPLRKALEQAQSIRNSATLEWHFDRWKFQNWERLATVEPTLWMQLFLESGSYSQDLEEFKASQGLLEIHEELSKMGVDAKQPEEIRREIDSRLQRQGESFRLFAERYGPLGVFRSVSPEGMAFRKAFYPELLGDYINFASHIRQSLLDWDVLSFQPWLEPDFQLCKAKKEQQIQYYWARAKEAAHAEKLESDNLSPDEWVRLFKRRVTQWLEAYLTRDFPEGRPFRETLDSNGGLYHYPATLLFAIWQQISLDVIDGTRIGRCVACGSWFSARGRQRSGDRIKRMCTRRSCQNKVDYERHKDRRKAQKSGKAGPLAE